MGIERVRTAMGGISGGHITPCGAAGHLDEALLQKVVRRTGRRMR